MIWITKNADALGLIPEFLSESDPRSAKQQFQIVYAHGGGWRPFSGFDRTDRGLEFPGDPPMELVGFTMLREEMIEVYQYSWVCIVQPDGSYEVARMD